MNVCVIGKEKCQRTPYFCTFIIWNLMREVCGVIDSAGTLQKGWFRLRRLLEVEYSGSCRSI